MVLEKETRFCFIKQNYEWNVIYLTRKNSMKATILILWSLLFLTMVNTAFAQVKYEKEYRLDIAEVPDSARQFLAELAFEKRIKWYQEEGLEDVSIEAKTKNKGNRKKYSIEFDKNGIFEDVEIEIGWAEIPSAVQHRVCSYLDRSFDKFKIERAQVQFTGEHPAIKAKVREASVQPSPQVTTRYELIAKVKKEKNFQKLELLFNLEGELIRQSRIVSTNTDNLEY